MVTVQPKDIFSKTTKSQIACKGLGMLFYHQPLSPIHWQCSTQLHNYNGWMVTLLALARPAFLTFHILLKWCSSHLGTQPYKWLSPYRHTNNPRKQEIHLFSHQESFISFLVDCMDTKAHWSPLVKLYHGPSWYTESATVSNQYSLVH